MEASCVIPAFENPDLLGRCLLSALSQEEIELEVIVSDDSHSTSVRDLTAALAVLFPSLRYFAGPRSGNPVDNWNRGLDLAQGRMCVVVHHDEFFIDRRFLRRAVDRIDRERLPAVIGGTLVLGVERPSRFRAANAVARALGAPLWMLPSLNWLGPTAAFVFRRGPRFDPNLVQLVDVEFYRRVLGAGPAVFLDGACVGSLGHHSASITATIDTHAMAMRELRLLQSAAKPLLGRVEYAGHRLYRRLRSWRG
ncbi:MAG TPA: glycosyltransferase [Caulobacteraceae bacterium]